jgi:SagB-type dehydrogenase family enzyme
MRFEALDRLPADLTVTGSADLWQLYHQSSKLRLETARREAAAFAVSERELFVSSRGFKQFRNGAAIPLAPPVSSPRPLEDVLLQRRSARRLEQPLRVGELGTVLQLALGPSAITTKAEHGVEQMLRTWPSAGGLYPLDAYILASRVEGLDPAVYHYNVPRGELERLTAVGELADHLAECFFWQDFATDCAAAVILVAAFDRTVAKYGARGYRLVLLDAGHAAQNLLLCAAQQGLPAVPMAGFSDTALEALLDLDGAGESVVHTVLLGGADR